MKKRDRYPQRRRMDISCRPPSVSPVSSGSGSAPYAMSPKVNGINRKKRILLVLRMLLLGIDGGVGRRTMAEEV